MHFYEGLGHSFLNPRQDANSNREQGAAKSLERTFAFFHEELSEATAQPEESDEVAPEPVKSKRG